MVFLPNMRKSDLEFEKNQNYEFFIQGRDEGLIAELQGEGENFLCIRPLKKPQHTLWIAKKSINWARLVSEEGEEDE